MYYITTADFNKAIFSLTMVERERKREIQREREREREIQRDTEREREIQRESFTMTYYSLTHR